MVKPVVCQSAPGGLGPGRSVDRRVGLGGASAEPPRNHSVASGASPSTKHRYAPAAGGPARASWRHRNISRDPAGRPLGDSPSPESSRVTCCSGPGRSAAGCCSLALMMVGIACGSATGPVEPSTGGRAAASAIRRIVVLGDSLAVSPTRTDAFPARLQERLDATYPGWIVGNEGVGGDTTSDGLQRLDRALSQGTAILILELGANDGLRGTPLDTIEANLSAIIERVRARGITVLLCGMETPPRNGWSYTLEYHRLFPRLAARYEIPLVPFLLEGVALNPELNGDDLIHPNAAGARRIADTVWPHLEQLVVASAAKEANERERVSHATGAGIVGPRERACRGSGGAAPRSRRTRFSVRPAGMAREQKVAESGPPDQASRSATSSAARYPRPSGSGMSRAR
jgi:acyl-CoA thioesterase I